VVGRWGGGEMGGWGKRGKGEKGKKGILPSAFCLLPSQSLIPNP